MTATDGQAGESPEYPPTYWDLVDGAATTWAAHVLLADDHARSLTGATLREAALAVAAGLHERGVRPGHVVSWQLPTTLEAMVVMLALARIGAVQNPIIPILGEREVGFITAQIGTDVLIVPEEWRGVAHGDLARAAGETQGFEVLVADHATDPTTTGGRLRLPTGDPATLPPAPSESGGDVRWLYYSSGTTAEPKGARHTDRSVMASASGVIGPLGARADDVNPLAFPISHIGGVTMMTASLLTGMRLVLFDAFDPTTTPERMAALGATQLGSAVPFYVAYLAAQERHGAEPLFPRLRAVVGGGAPVPGEIGVAVRGTLRAPGIANAWGLTEFPVAASPSPDDPPAVLDHTAGRPVPGVRVRVVDAAERPLGVGEEGELRLKGPQCFLGYVDASLDADAFDAEGWFRTGDLGLVDGDGNVRVTGRLKDVIIRNAENISALEIEEAVLRHPDVADVAVIGVPDPRTGERVCAVTVPVPGAQVALDALVDHCRRLGVPRHKLPERLAIVDVLPRNTLGKVLKNELRTRFA
jgi:acyl-CoA synthetase (AMP-forming)/AMP-acid ligase II